MKWLTHWKRFTYKKKKDMLPEIITKHKSLLLKKLGETEMIFQHNKVTNLRLAISKINGVLIPPGKTFSFWKMIGNPTRKKGYLDGLVVCRGEMTSGLAGGVCQLSNMIHWMVIHSDLDVTERHTHAFDAFPDNNRVIPFGSGATVSYNFYDLMVTNNTNNTYQFMFSISDEFLHGEIRSSEQEKDKHHIIEKNHRFIKCNNVFYRQNELWKKSNNKKTGDKVSEIMIIRNHSEVRYEPDTVT